MALILVGYFPIWAVSKPMGWPPFVDLAIGLSLGLALMTVPEEIKKTKKAFYQAFSSSMPLILVWAYSFSLALAAFDTKNILWLVFSGALLYRLLTIRDVSHNVIRFTSYLATLGALGYLAFNRQVIVSSSLARLSLDSEAYTLVAYAALVGLAAVAMGKMHSWFGFYIALVQATTLTVVIIFSGTRSVMFGLICVLVVFATRITKARGILALLLVIAPMVLMVNFLPIKDTIVERATVTANRGVLGVANLISSSPADYEEQSSLGRRNQRSTAIRNFFEDPLTGRGYKSLWVDFPLVQAFSDAGIVFGLLFAIAFLLVPVSRLLPIARHGSDVHKFFALVYLINLPRLFLHGQPYDWTTYAWACPYICLVVPKMLKSSEQGELVTLC